MTRLMTSSETLPVYVTMAVLTMQYSLVYELIDRSVLFGHNGVTDRELGRKAVLQKKSMLVRKWSCSHRREDDDDDDYGHDGPRRRCVSWTDVVWMQASHRPPRTRPDDVCWGRRQPWRQPVATATSSSSSPSSTFAIVADLDPDCSSAGPALPVPPQQ